MHTLELFCHLNVHNEKNLYKNVIKQVGEFSLKKSCASGFCPEGKKKLKIPLTSLVALDKGSC